VTIILGLGFTGAALARRLRDRGEQVVAPVREVLRFRELASQGVQLSEWDFTNPDRMNLPRGQKIAWLIPPVPEPDCSALRRLVEKIEPNRVVYVSSTGVYGNTTEVNESSPPAPVDDRGRCRIDDEQWMAGHSWSTLIFRSAAIYGPGRGVQQAVKEGRLPRGAGSGSVSRIHVDDLAALIDAGLQSTIEGAWPVADEEPCASDEIIRWCEEYLDVKAARSESTASPSLYRQGSIGGRSVDARRIFELLGMRLQHRSWRTGVRASL
jgi:nucleoside-diphosphate-sugar epimerase